MREHRTSHAIAIAVPALALLAVALPLTSCSAEKATTGRFATRSQAPVGAIPAWLPVNASDIIIQEVQATGALWLRFRITAQDRPGFEKLLTRIPDSQIATITVRAPSGADWWFGKLAEPGKGDSKALEADVFSGLGTPVPAATLVALDRKSDAVFAWRLGH